MEKTTVISALGCCAAGICGGCPYEGVIDCDSEMCKDAIALLKANKPANPKYTLVNIYTKKANLLPYFQGKASDNYPMNELTYKRQREYYAMEREIQLIALFRYDGTKCFCKIKCPVNPLPVKGEFECPSMGVVDHWLKANGWDFKQKLCPRMFE